MRHDLCHVPGGTFLFTLRLAERRSRLLVERIDDLRAAVRHVRKTQPFLIEAAVVLPDRMHMIWQLPEGDDDNRARWERIMTVFAEGQCAVPAGQVAGQTGRARLWRKGFGEITIRGEADLSARRHWVIAAPVRAGLVTRAGDWPHGSGWRGALAWTPPVARKALIAD